MSIRAMRAVDESEIGDPTGKAVLYKIADNADDAGECWPSVQTLARGTEWSERTVQRKVRWLERNGYLIRLFRAGRSTLYRIPLETLETRSLFKGGDTVSPLTECHPRQPDGGDCVSPRTQRIKERSKPILGSDKLNLRAHAREGKTGKAEGTPSTAKPKTALAERLFMALWGRGWSNAAGEPTGEALKFAPLIYRTAGQIARGQIAEATVFGYAGDCRDDAGVKHKGPAFAGLLKAHWARANAERARQEAG